MINFVIPKGSLEAQTLTLLEKSDLPLKRASDRDYNGKILDPRIGRVKILRPQEISRYVEEGYFDLGITGLDWVEENQSKVVIISSLTYAKGGVGSMVKIVLGVDKNLNITSPKQLKPNLKVSTEYPNLTKRYFAKIGLPVIIYLSYGATEAKVPDIVDAVVDVTETGTTLAKNGIQIVDVLLESPAVLIANKTSYRNPQKKKEIEEIKTLLLGVLEAEGKVLIKLNIQRAKLSQILQLIPAMKNPTISHLVNPDYVAVESVISKTEINLLIPQLKSAGAEDIIELPITKVVK